MTPAISKSLEDKITGLLASLAVTNEGVMNLTKISEKHESVLYGKDDSGGMVTRINVTNKTLEEHENALQRLENSCQQVVNFMEGQVKINDSTQKTLENMNKVILALGVVVFLILILIGVADITALHNLLAGIKIP